MIVRVGTALRAFALPYKAVPSLRRRAGALRRHAALLLRARVGDAPDGAAGVVGNEQRAVLGDGERGRSAPHLGAMHARDPEAGGEVLVPALRTAILERHAHYLVADRLRPVPRALHRHE